ncbi:coiled-coil domain-containing protein 103 [Drosophila ficusphila]|uniref:coiled-coil domain-containing protein 103 n=1 Tax=Drosophila ficusphila TaxID=30025 RepID=UPI0007E8228F|nr:coiled-coil domain-containing protein 103 [Drosophila ficusphila]
MEEWKITPEEIIRLRDSCLKCIRDGELYELRNDAKLRAVYSTQSYEEFKDIVDAAHLRPVTRSDKNNVQTKSRLWNSAARH